MSTDKPFSHEIKNGQLVPAGERHLRAARSKIGMVFQQFNLFPNMTVLENITEAQIHVLHRSKAEAEARARELLALVGLADKEIAHPNTLSGGQQQRVAIARALAMDPEILLLDEVTSALDPELVSDVLDVLRTIAATTDITMLIVTHEMGFARDVADRVLVFDAGKIVEEGPPEQISTPPLRTARAPSSKRSSSIDRPVCRNRNLRVRSWVSHLDIIQTARTTRATTRRKITVVVSAGCALTHSLIARFDIDDVLIMCAIPFRRVESVRGRRENSPRHAVDLFLALDRRLPHS